MQDRINRILVVGGVGATVAISLLSASQSRLALLAAAAGVGLVVLVLLAALARRWPAIVLGLLAAMVVLTPKSGPKPLISPYGLSVLPSDIVLVVAALAALACGRTVARNLDRHRLSTTVIAVLLVVQSVLGVTVYGASAVLDARQLLTLVAVVVYLLSFERFPQTAVRRWLYLTCGALVLVAAYRGLTAGFGTVDELIVLNDGAYVTSRVLLSNQTALVAAGMVTAWNDWATGKGIRYATVTLVFAATVTVAQHRSVWVAGLVALLVVTVRVPARRLVLSAATIVLLLMLVSPLIVYSPVATGLGDLVASASQSASLTTGTGGDRVESARVLIHEGTHSGPVRSLLGEPFGAGYERVVHGRFEEYQPHNAYVQTFLRGGLVGVVAVLGLLFSAWWSAVKGRAVEPAAGWLTVFAVYSLAYGFPLELAPLVAAALTDWRRSPPETAAPRVDERRPSVTTRAGAGAGS